MPSEPTAKAMMTAVRNDPALAAAIQADPIRGMEQAAEQAKLYSKEGDQFIYRTVVIVLSVTLLITVVGVLLLTLLGKDYPVPTEVVALGSTALGGLVGLLAPSPVRTPS